MIMFVERINIMFAMSISVNVKTVKISILTVKK